MHLMLTTSNTHAPHRRQMSPHVHAGEFIHSLQLEVAGLKAQLVRVAASKTSWPARLTRRV